AAGRSTGPLRKDGELHPTPVPVNPGPLEDHQLIAHPRLRKAVVKPSAPGRRTLVTDPNVIASRPTAATLPVAVMRNAERPEVDPAAADLVARARRGGAPLDSVLRPLLEVALGTRLDGVRVHTGPDADAAANALGARAFAV